MTLKNFKERTYTAKDFPINIFPFLIVLTLLLLGCKSKQKTKYEFLKTISTDINKTCPVQVDSILKLENTLAQPIATFRYNYVLKYDTVKYDIHEFEKSLTKTTLNSVRTSPDAKMFRDMYATLEYNYCDTLGNYLFRIVIKPQDYK